MSCGVYWFYQISKDLAIYVGSSINIKNRLGRHKSELRRGVHPNVHLQRIWNKYGKDDISISILEECELNVTLDREQFWMDALNPICNVALVAGRSAIGRKWTEQQRLDASNRMIGFKHSDETKGILSDLRRGKPMNDETKRKISNSNKGIKKGPMNESARKNMSLSSLNDPIKMKRIRDLADKYHKQPVSDETRKKLSIASKKARRTGKKHSQETRDKMSMSHTGKKQTQETKDKRRETFDNTIKARNKKGNDTPVGSE